MPPDATDADLAAVIEAAGELTSDIVGDADTVIIFNVGTIVNEAV